MELHELQILARQASPRRHPAPVSGTSMRRRARKVRPSVTPRRQHRIRRLEPMQRPILEVEGDNAPTRTVIHEKIESEVLDEVVAIVFKRLSVQGVEEGVAGAVGDAAAPMRLPALSEVQRLSTEGALVDPSVFRSGKRHAVVFQLENGLGGLAGHVVYGILVAEPIGAFDGVVHVPFPVVVFHVPDGRVDAALRCDGVGTGGEEFGDDGGFEASIDEPERCSQPGPTGSHNDCIVFVIDHLVAPNCVLLPLPPEHLRDEPPQGNYVT